MPSPAMHSAASAAPYGLLPQEATASMEDELPIDCTHPLVEAHEEFHEANGQLLTRNTLHAMLGGVLLITSEVVRREAAYILTLPDMAVPTAGWRIHADKQAAYDAMDAFGTLSALSITWLLYTYFEEAYCHIARVRTMLNMIVVELAAEVSLLVLWAAAMCKNQFYWLDILLAHESVAAYLAVGIVFAIPFLLFLGAFQVLVLMCTRSSRIEGGSYLTLGFEAFLESTTRIKLDDEMGSDDELESLLSDDDEEQVVRESRSAQEKA